MKKPVVLIIMDGLALAPHSEGNAVTNAKTPNLDTYQTRYPTTTLRADGLNVGLPEGQMGNSEVGHLNLGGGRIVYQSLTRIHKAITDGAFFTNEAYVNAIAHAKHNHSRLHVLGLLSDGGVHSHIDHFKAMLTLAKQHSLNEIVVHAFLDGRDVPPRSAITYIEALEAFMHTEGIGMIASVHGRYYAMDRDKNWERTQHSYDVLTRARGPRFDSAKAGIEASYSEDIGDEFVVPFVIQDTPIETDDAVIFLNFRPDRAIQMSLALTNPKLTGIQDPKHLEGLHYVSTMHYHFDVKGSLAFDLQSLDNMYGEVIAKAGLKQLRIAETEKYAHVTFFFDGGVDKEIAGSERILINSPKVATYDLKPEMGAYEITEKVCEALDREVFDTVILNFANPDMVGHTGSIPATIQAVETVDACVGTVVEKVLEKGGVAIVTADHGNAEQMIDATGGIHTAHTTNPVPIIITESSLILRDDGILGDIAPTMLDLLNVTQPVEMTGTTLIKKIKND